MELDKTNITNPAQTQEPPSNTQNVDAIIQHDKAKQNRNPKKISDVWDHYKIITGGDPKNPRCVCIYCGADYAYNPTQNGTSMLRAHLNKCKKFPGRAEATSQKLLSFTKNDEGSSSLATMSWTKEGAQEHLAKYIILDELPFRHLEGEGFKLYSRYMNPKFDPPSRMTIARDVYNLYVDEKKKIKNMLSKEKVCLTTDTWTSIQNINYMCVIAHWIDGDWKLHKRIIGFFKCPIMVYLKDWGIWKVFTVTVDNASSNVVALSRLKTKLGEKKGAVVLNGDLLHMRCVCHILNLVVGDGLDELHYSISAIRNAVRYCRSSPARITRFKECAHEENIQSNALLCLDVPTRWNATYLMLEAALKFNKAFTRLEGDLNYTSYFEEKMKGKKIDGPPSEVDWDNASVFLKFLKTFYELTLKFSGAASMLKKFDKYWGDPEKMNVVLFLGIVLDPRYKLEYVAVCFSYIYEEPVAKRMLKSIEVVLRRLFHEYDDIPPPVTNSRSILEETSEFNLTEASTLGAKRQIHSTFLKQKAVKRGGIEKKEVDRYLEADLDEFGDDFNILTWWKQNSNRWQAERNASWNVWLREKYNCVKWEDMDKLSSSKSCSVIVQDVLKAVAKLSELGLLGLGSLKWEVFDGESTLLWKDLWYQDKPLLEKFSRLYSIPKLKHKEIRVIKVLWDCYDRDGEVFWTTKLRN
ncbi:zinc finger BED domain-containing protein RICESLEEPER 2-like [Apium graveolens]|uniref:zinc finger BED domain-containing protein RICESLEEPER 2-like n=1 Tax=Apium graveolens TaxID=4045 RepID=UPI003D7BA6CB